MNGLGKKKVYERTYIVYIQVGQHYRRAKIEMRHNTTNLTLYSLSLFLGEILVFIRHP